MSSLTIENLIGGLIEAYEIGLDEGSVRALGTLTDLQDLTEKVDAGWDGRDEPCNDPYAAVAVEADAPDPDVFYLDNLGDRVLKIEQALAASSFVRSCGPGCPCKGF